MVVTTNFPMPRKENRASSRQTNRQDTILRGKSGDTSEQINNPCHFSVFRPSAFARVNLTRTVTRFPNAAHSCDKQASACGDRILGRK